MGILHFVQNDSISRLLDTPRKRWRCGSPRRCAARDDEEGYGQT